MWRFLPVSCLTLSCLLAQSPSPSGGAAAEAAQPPARRDVIVVTGTWEPLPLEEADRAVTARPVREQSILFQNVIDFLQLDPSLDVRRRAPGGVQTDLSIRGATFGQALILLNGRRLNDPQSGHHSLDIPAPLDAIQSVEVLRGAGSTLYGSDALGGAVNIRTAAPESWGARVRLAAGSFGTQQQMATVSGKAGALAQSLAFSRDFSRGFLPNRDYRNLSASSHTLIESRHGKTGIDLGYADKPFGAQDFYGPYPSWERTKTWFASLHHNFPQRWEAALSYRRHSDLFYLFRDNPQRYQNHHVADGFHGSLRRRDHWRGGVTLFTGAEAFTDHIESSNLGTHSRARGAAYAALDIRALRRFSLSLGLRSESYRGAFDQVSPALSGAWWANSRLKLRASASRAYRLPTFTDLYYRDPANSGNAGLRPETAWNYEFGADLRPSGSWRFEATAFHRRDRDGIDYASPSPQGPWHALNITRLNFTGLETSAAWQRRSHLAEFSYTGMRAVSTLPAGIFTKYVMNYPIHSGVFSWTGSAGKILARTRLGALERRARSPYAVWDFALSWRGRRISPFVQATNLTNTRYEEILRVPMPGRAFLAGLELR
ncbi:MAG: TonB-dependent receptor [Bryobacteraceae bacterium]